MGQQPNWRFCQKCHVMFFEGAQKDGDCPIAGGHVAQGFVFNLAYDFPENPNAQANWRCCGKCDVLFYDGSPDKGKCLAGGGHEAQGYNYTLPHEVVETANAQGAWRTCQFCGAMFFDGYVDKGPCPGNPAPLSKVAGPHFRFGPHQASGFDFVLPHDVASPPPPGLKLDITWTGPVWVLSLTHEQTEALEGILGTLASIPVAAALSEAAAYIQLMDAIGGDQGVDVQGVLGVYGVIVTPHASGMPGQLVKVVGGVVGSTTIVNYILKGGAQLPEVAGSLGIQAAAKVYAAVATGSALGTALAAAIGLAVDLLQPPPDPNAHGGIHADRVASPTVPGLWEKFILSQIGPNKQVAPLSWLGLFSAQNRGGGDVYANRPQLGDWETWTLVDNRDGTVSFQAADGVHLLTAINGGGDGSYCTAATLYDTVPIKSTERFIVTTLPNGHVTLQTKDKRTFLTVQPGK